MDQKSEPVKISSKNDTVGSAMVVGAGIAGMQAPGKILRHRRTHVTTGQDIPYQ